MRNKYKEKEYLKGFTIIELLTVMSVIAILSMVVWINYNSLNKEFVLERSARMMAQDAREALEMALSSRDLDGAPDDFRGGYGIHFPLNENYYLVFADKEDNKFYNPGVIEISKRYFEDKERIKITNIVFNSDCSVPLNNYNLKSAVFLPPDPEVFIGGSHKCDFLEVTIKHDDLPGQKKEVKINKIGLIEVK